MRRAIGPWCSAFLACALLCACGGGDTKASPASAPDPAAKTAVPPAPSAPAVPAPAPATAPARKAEISDDDARALIASWLAAQNEGDYARYAALYAARFTGVRRTRDEARSFDHAGWLADRKRMFAKPMQVKAGELHIAQAGATAVVRFDQEWSTATYRDLGPKQMVLVREPGGVRIAREELLSSSPLPAGGSSARFVAHLGGRSYVLLEPCADELRGELVAAAGGSPAVAVFTRDGAEPVSVKAWRNGALRLIGAEGSCETPAGALRQLAIGYPHFGVIETWNGGDGSPPVATEQIAQEIAESYPFWLALEIAQPCTKQPVLALPAGAPAAQVLAERPVADALRARAQQAFAALPQVKKLGADERTELLGELQLKAYGRDGAEWIAASAATSCAYGVELLALFRVEGDQLRKQRVTREPWSVWALLDLDGDGQPEIAGTPWAPDAWLLFDSRTGKVLQRADIPFNDCPC